MTTFGDVAEFISGEASDEDIARIYDFCKARTKVLRSIRGAAVSKGATVELTDLSPQYLNGLTGEVTSINGQRCNVTLDERSTDTLKWTRQNRFDVGEQTRYTLHGIPLSACTPRETA